MCGSYMGLSVKWTNLNNSNGSYITNKKRQKIDHPEVMLCLFCKVCVSFLLSTAGLSFNTTEPFKVLAYNPFKGAAVQLKLKIRSSNKASK